MIVILTLLAAIVQSNTEVFKWCMQFREGYKNDGETIELNGRKNQKANNLNQCRDLCQGTEGCNAVTFLKGTDGRPGKCWLRSGATVWKDEPHDDGRGSDAKICEITEPCECAENGGGWDSETNMCIEESTTTCGECSTMSTCKHDNCAVQGCALQYDPLEECQCTANCEEFGNCCPDFTEALCVTDPCECPEGYGWDKDTSSCLEGSSTTCEECDTMDGCKNDQCEVQGCSEYDAMQTCQCTPNCEEFGNCCPDFNEALCVTDPCECPEGYGWDKDTSSCVEGSSTTCDECPTMADCKGDLCAVQGCPERYNPFETCQCTARCKEFGNCCPDYTDALCVKDPCGCPEGYGWSSYEGKCMEGSTTNCEECPTMDTCKTEECAVQGCAAEFDPLQTCQCTADCEEHDDCCPDFTEALCVTDPCECPEGYGWDKDTSSCVEGSTTSCDECSTMDTCKTHHCDVQGCSGEYDPTQTCQCTATCEEYGNCCPDFHEALCVTDPCECPEGYGWDKDTNSCVEGSSTTCDECGSMADCKGDLCAVQGCAEEYSPLQTCQCTANCEEFGNCCPDFTEALCVTDPCECPEGYGWSTDSGACEEGSVTTCGECATKSGCKSDQCAVQGCAAEYDSEQTCQCTADCAEHENCCPDFTEALCVTDPCGCPEGYGWSTSESKCVEGGTTVCEECTTMDGCKNDMCEVQGCQEVYDITQVCQCSKECAEYDNCCPDYTSEICAKMWYLLEPHGSLVEGGNGDCLEACGGTGECSLCGDGGMCCSHDSTDSECDEDMDAAIPGNINFAVCIVPNPPPEPTVYPEVPSTQCPMAGILEGQTVEDWIKSCDAMEDCGGFQQSPEYQNGQVAQYFSVSVALTQEGCSLNVQWITYIKTPVEEPEEEGEPWYLKEDPADLEQGGTGDCWDDCDATGECDGFCGEGGFCCRVGYPGCTADQIATLPLGVTFAVCVTPTQNQPCCRAATAECNACAAGTTVEEYCQWYVGAVGCPDVAIDPLNGNCPAGYNYIEPAVSSVKTPCEGSQDPDVCILTKSQAAAFCARNECSVVSVTTDTTWNRKFRDSVILGVGPEYDYTDAYENTASCVKDFGEAPFGHKNRACAHAGTTMEERDEACEGDMVCAQSGQDGRNLGDCPGAYCCSALLEHETECYSQGSTVSARDAACAGEMECARKGWDGRNYGDCDNKHCCSYPPVELVDGGYPHKSGQCWSRGATMEEMDDRCAGDMICARNGWHGRTFGDCILRHCCTNLLPEKDRDCYFSAKTMEGRDALCAGDMVCARNGYDGRDFGACFLGHCCTHPPVEPLVTPAGLPHGDLSCYDSTKTVAERDALCAGDMVCARDGWDGRSMGDCRGHHCCSNQLPEGSTSCYGSRGNKQTTAQRDAVCQGDLVCARQFYDNRNYGGFWHHTCTHVPGSAQVSCGAHYANSCSSCPGNHGANWCNGDCTWVNDMCVPAAGLVVDEATEEVCTSEFSGWKKYANSVELYVNALGCSRVQSLSACQQKCENTPGCKMFEFQKHKTGLFGRGYQCCLEVCRGPEPGCCPDENDACGRWKTGGIASSWDSYGRVDTCEGTGATTSVVIPPTPQVCSSPVGEYTHYPNSVEMYVNTLGCRKVNSLQECQDRCDNTPGCLLFEFQKSKTGLFHRGHQCCMEVCRGPDAGCCPGSTDRCTRWVSGGLARDWDSYGRTETCSGGESAAPTTRAPTTRAPTTRAPTTKSPTRPTCTQTNNFVKYPGELQWYDNTGGCHKVGSVQECQNLCNSRSDCNMFEFELSANWWTHKHQCCLERCRGPVGQCSDCGNDMCSKWRHTNGWDSYVRQSTCMNRASEAKAAYMVEPLPASEEDWLMYGFAVIGAGAVILGLTKQFTRKHEEYTPILQQA